MGRTRLSPVRSSHKKARRNPADFSLSLIVYLQLLNLKEPIRVFQLKLLVVP
jgi:hypothetical protein